MTRYTLFNGRVEVDRLSIQQWSQRTISSCRALLSVCEKIGTPGEALLAAYKPRVYTDRIEGRSMAEVGCEPILHMRGFQKTKSLPESFVKDIQARSGSN